MQTLTKRMQILPNLVITGGLLWGISGAMAVEVFKCTDAQGRVSFSQTQCPSASQMQIQDIKPIDTIKAQAANPQDLRYAEEYRQRRDKERRALGTRTGKASHAATNKEEKPQHPKSKRPKKPKKIKSRPSKLRIHGRLIPSYPSQPFHAHTPRARLAP